MQLAVMTSRFRVNMINALRLKSNSRTKKRKTKVISFDILNESETLKEVNVIEISVKDFKQKWKHYNFYTQAMMIISSHARKAYTISNVLVNEEAMMNLMSECMIRQMNLTFKSSTVSVRIENESYERLHETCFIKLIVQKVFKHVSFSIILNNSSYKMLLRRSWLWFVEVIENYYKNIYHIRDTKENQHRVEAIKSFNYRSISSSHIKLNDKVKETHQVNDEVLLYNEETLTELKMTWNKMIDDVLKRVFKKAISQKKEK